MLLVHAVGVRANEFLLRLGEGTSQVGCGNEDVMEEVYQLINFPLVTYFELCTPI